MVGCFYWAENIAVKKTGRAGVYRARCFTAPDVPPYTAVFPYRFSRTDRLIFLKQNYGENHERTNCTILQFSGPSHISVLFFVLVAF